MEILNTMQGSVDVFGIIAGVLLSGFAILALCIVIFAFYEGEVGAGIGALLITVFLGLFSYVSITESLVKSPTQYEVKITDYNEIYEKGYEIIEKRGDIYVIQKSEAK